MKRTIMMMLCLIAMAASMNAQSISGKLVDEKNEPLAYANIVLQQADSTFVNGQTSDEKGGFRFSKVSAGDYRLVISSLGYQTMYVDLQGFSRSANLGTLTVEEASQKLDGECLWHSPIASVPFRWGRTIPTKGRSHQSYGSCPSGGRS